jgi:hypothetical protein
LLDVIYGGGSPAMGQFYSISWEDVTALRLLLRAGSDGFLAASRTPDRLSVR